MKPLNDALLRLMAHLHGLVSEGAKERGQTLSEYTLITIVAVGVTVAAVIAFRGALT